jgi:hypothetical protein
MLKCTGMVCISHHVMLTWPAGAYRSLVPKQHNTTASTPSPSISKLSSPKYSCFKPHPDDRYLFADPAGVPRLDQFPTAAGQLAKRPAKAAHS